LVSLINDRVVEFGEVHFLREQGAGSREQGTGNREQGTGKKNSVPH